MIDLLDQILCWIKQIGAMVLGALIAGLNLVIAAIGNGAQGVLNAWPLSMPDLPAMPAGLLEAWGWVRWLPIPVDATLAFVLFYVSASLLWFGASILLRWAKAID